MKDFYNPSFYKNAKGGYNKQSAVTAIKGGTDAYLLENELNELQWILREDLKSLIKTMTKSGCIQIGEHDKNQSGSFSEFGTAKLNSFSIYPFDAILNGQLVNIYSTNGENKLFVTLDEPPTGRGEERYDLVYLEFWESEVRFDDKVYTYGGLENDELANYDIKDKDINVETSRRVQFQWQIRTVSGIDYNRFSNGFEGNNNEINHAIIPYGHSNGSDNSYIFCNYDEDENLYRAGNGDIASQEYFKCIDGYIYAMPLMIIKRMNSAGYDPIDNPNGSQNYVDSTSIPENNGKFSNVIYSSDIIVDLRKLSYVGSEQLSNMFVTQNEFNNFSQVINNIINNNYSELNTFVKELHNYVHNDIKTDLDLKAYKTDLDLLGEHLQLQIDELIKKVNKNIEILEDHEQRIRNIELYIKKVGYDPDAQDFLKYGMPIKRRNIFVPGGTIEQNLNGEEVVVSNGVVVETDTQTSLEYTACVSLYEVAGGKIGDVWYEKADSSYIVKNTGEYGLAARAYHFDLSKATMIRSGNGVFTQNGYVINQSITDTDFVVITPNECLKGENGDLSFEFNGNNLTVYNTGNYGNKFEWFIIDTTQLRNIELLEIEIDGVNSNNIVKTGDYGTEFDVIIGTISDIEVDGTIGEIYVTKSHNSFSLEFTGTAKCKVRCLVLKEINLGVGIV